MGQYFQKNPQYVVNYDEDINQKYEEFEKNHKFIKIEDSIFAFEPLLNMGNHSTSNHENEND